MIELLIVILIIGLLIGTTMPNYRMVVNKARTAAVEMNMRNVSQAITAFYAENGYYADDFYEDGYGYIFDGGKKDVQLGQFPTNPYTGKFMEPDEFNTDEYDSEDEVNNTSEDGPNDEWGFQAGEMRYSTYTPLGMTHPILWGLIGFDHSGRSIRRFDQDNSPVILVMH
jgi:type II secretory pathway pseudopilin PulG